MTYAATAGTVPILSTWTHQNLAINGNGGTFTVLVSGLTINNLAVTTGTLTTVSAGNYSLTANGSVFINGGVLTLNASPVTVDGGWTYTSGIFTPGTSTVTFAGSGTQVLTSGNQPFTQFVLNGSGETLQLNGGIVVSSLTPISGTMDAMASSSPLTVSGSMIFNGGSYNARGSSITIMRDWTMNSGSFIYGTSMVTFQNILTTSTLTGSTTFYSVNVSTAGKTLLLAAGSTQTVSGVLVLGGTPFKRVRVRSTLTGTQAFLVNTGTNGVFGVDVKDNNASGRDTIAAGSNSLDSTNNTNWTFTSGPAATRTWWGPRAPTGGTPRIGIRLFHRRRIAW